MCFSLFQINFYYCPFTDSQSIKKKKKSRYKVKQNDLQYKNLSTYTNLSIFIPCSVLHSSFNCFAYLMRQILAFLQEINFFNLLKC